MLKRKTNILSKNKSSGVKISENLLITFIAVMLATTVGCRKNESNASDSNIRYDEGSVVTETVTASEAMQTDEAAVSEAGAKAAQSYEQVPSTEPKPNTSVWEADKKPESKASALPANNNPEPLPETKPETPKRATAADTKAAADRVIYYLNTAREKIGSGKLQKRSDLTAYAEYRAVQLISNFAHDPDDWQKAAKATGYGKFTDMSEYGSDGYYDIGAQEAIAMAGIVGSADKIGQCLAQIIIESHRHWQYVGSDEMKYTGVGVTCVDDLWYTCIMVMATDKYEK